MTKKRTPIYYPDAGSHLLSHEKFPLSSKYHPHWVLENQMGPNVMWLTERLSGYLDLRPGMRVLDMGCGRGLSSIFLAKEYDVQVWATDLWTSASENWERFKMAGVEDKVIPIHAEAHNLPYAEGFFDAIFSVDAYHYFGTDQLYLGYISKFLKPGGQIGIVVPGLHKPWPPEMPSYLTDKQKHGGVFWAWDMQVFQTAHWWQQLWSQYPFFEVDACHAMADGGDIWLDWETMLEDSPVELPFPPDTEVLQADNNQYLTFIQAIGHRNHHQW